MKTVVITGSARGLGLEMAKVFRKNNLNVVISDINEENLVKAKVELETILSNSNVSMCICDVTKEEDIRRLIEFTKKEFGCIDIWINNAGVNQPNKAIWELDKEEIELVIDVSENIEVYKKYIPKSRREGWFNFVKDTKKTPAYKFYMEKHKEWYKET